MGGDVSAALAEGSAEMQAIEARIRSLGEENELLLDRLARFSAAGPDGVIAKLRVVLAELWPQDHPEVHRLIRSAIEDLVRFGR